MATRGRDESRVGPGGLYDLRWRDVWVGFAVSVAGTVVFGGLLFALNRNVWWVSVGSMAALVAGGFAAGRRARRVEPLNGALLACVFYGAEAVILLVGSATEGTAVRGLPDPLPGLAVGDSTFFFVSPLGQLGAALLGSLLGGVSARGRRATAQEPGAARSGGVSPDKRGGRR